MKKRGMKPGIYMILSSIFFILVLSPCLGAVVEITDCQLLDIPGTEYVLQNNITSIGSCFGVNGDDITLNLNGYTVAFYNRYAESYYHINQVDYSFGVICHPSYNPPDKPTSFMGGGNNFRLINGEIIQASKNTKHADTAYGTMSHAIYLRSCNNAELANLTIIANSQYDATPVRLRSVQNANVHDIEIHNNVQNITNRHWPGQSAILFEDCSGNSKIYNVNIIGGPHRGIAIGGTYENCEVYNNTISHNQKYVNGYAIAAGGENLDIHDNKIIPVVGRGVHITGNNILFHHNYLDLKLGRVVDHYSTDDYHLIFTNVHGIKFEGGTNSKAYSNTVIETQPGPDYAPCTPLNIDSEDTDANNEIFNNNFTAITYATTSGGTAGYGAFDTYATGFVILRCAGTNPGQIHHNNFYTNDRAFFKDNYACSNYKVYNNRFVRLPDATTNGKTFMYYNSNSASRGFEFDDNMFVGFEPDDLYLRNPSNTQLAYSLRFRLVLAVVDQAGDPVTAPQISIENVLGETVFDGTGDSDGILDLVLPMYELDTSGSPSIAYHTPYSISYEGNTYPVDLDRSRYVIINSVQKAAEYEKCDHGAIDGCMCAGELYESGYCCYDIYSDSPCEVFELETCSSLGGAGCARDSNTCYGGSFMMSSDRGFDCCSGECREIVIQEVPLCSLGDTDDRGSISVQELTGFINNWKAGSQIALVEVMTIIHEWKYGCPLL